MEIIENNVELINARLSELMVGANFYRFCYSGIYTITFALNREFCGFDFFKLDIATEFTIRKIAEISKIEPSSTADLHKIWSKDIKKVKVEQDLSLSLFFDDECLFKISSYLEDPERLFDLRWCVYQKVDVESFYVRVSNPEDIYLKKP